MDRFLIARVRPIHPRGFRLTIHPWFQRAYSGSVKRSPGVYTWSWEDATVRYRTLMLDVFGLWRVQLGYRYWRRPS